MRPCCNYLTFLLPRSAVSCIFIVTAFPYQIGENDTFLFYLNHLHLISLLHICQLIVDSISLNWIEMVLRVWQYLINNMQVSCFISSISLTSERASEAAEQGLGFPSLGENGVGHLGNVIFAYLHAAIHQNKKRGKKHHQPWSRKCHREQILPPSKQHLCPFPVWNSQLFPPPSLSQTYQWLIFTQILCLHCYLPWTLIAKSFKNTERFLPSADLSPRSQMEK